MSTSYATSCSKLQIKRAAGSNRYRRDSSSRRLELPGARSGVWQWGVSLLLWPLFIIAASCACLLLYRYATSHEYFTLREIEVSGNRRLTSAEIMQAGGVHLGMNTLDLAMHDVRARLLGNPWVESAKVARELPSTFRLSVVEREPRWWVQQEGGLFYADEQGRIIAPVEPRGFISLPLIRLENADSSLLAVLNRLQQMAEAKRLPFTMQEVGWVRLSQGGGVELHLEAANITIAMEHQGLMDQVARLRAVWDDLTQRGELEQVAALRLTGEKLWVERTMQAAVGAKPATESKPATTTKGAQTSKKPARS
ncbi:cell division protein FtsQ/DivIB [Megalodesulfovibrio gigas]|uniref:cell division protein FtsQ/DivIB n=1 Tax=Megalodesulfovibrio gigas TaxID=879 RepID=UPI0006877F96|nr:FtsQ-type POTRA domain-containing protein [Megalodesulfovibrio gigas]